MTKSIRLELVGTDVTAIAHLLEEHAPRTCEALWDALQTPIEGKAIHGMYSGREVFMDLPEANRTFNPLAIPRENGTIYPLPGDIAWAYFPPHTERSGFPAFDEGYDVLKPSESEAGVEQASGFWNLAFVYGPEVLFTSSLGIRAISVWASIQEGLGGFARECARVRTHDGPKTLRIERWEN